MLFCFSFLETRNFFFSFLKRKERAREKHRTAVYVETMQSEQQTTERSINLWSSFKFSTSPKISGLRSSNFYPA